MCKRKLQIDTCIYNCMAIVALTKLGRQEDNSKVLWRRAEIAELHQNSGWLAQKPLAKEEQLTAAHEQMRKLHEEMCAMPTERDGLHEMWWTTELRRTEKPTVSPIEALSEFLCQLPEAQAASI